MDQELISMQMAQYMKVNGIKTFNMELEKKLGPTAITTKESMCKVKSKEKVNSYGQTATLTKVNSISTKSMVKAHTPGMMEEATLDSG